MYISGWSSFKRFIHLKWKNNLTVLQQVLGRWHMLSLRTNVRILKDLLRVNIATWSQGSIFWSGCYVDMGTKKKKKKHRQTYEWSPWTPPSTCADMVLFSNFSSPEYIMELWELWHVVKCSTCCIKDGTAIKMKHTTHRRIDRLFAPMSWQPCWIPAIR